MTIYRVAHLLNADDFNQYLVKSIMEAIDKCADRSLDDNDDKEAVVATILAELGVDP